MFDNLNDKVKKFAQEKGYKGTKYIGLWKNYKVYEPYIDDKQVSFSGLPLVILVNENGDIRMSTSDEAMETLDDKSFIESFEENNSNNMVNNTIDQSVINNVVDNIDEKIRQLESQKDNNIQRTTNINEIEKDKKIKEDLKEVEKYSIINKSEEELFLAKKKFIDNWNYLLINQIDNQWIVNSSIYRVHIQSIIEAILRKTIDEKSQKELEYLQQAAECIQNQNRVILIKIVFDMKTIESY